MAAGGGGVVVVVTVAQQIGEARRAPCPMRRLSHPLQHHQGQAEIGGHAGTAVQGAMALQVDLRVDHAVEVVNRRVEALLPLQKVPCETV